MRVVAFSLNKSKLKAFLRGHKEVKFNPELVVCYGGDGTLLLAEEKYPKVKKLFFYKTKDCKCDLSKLKFEEYMKLDVFLNGKKVFCALNDVNVHYKMPRALRFAVRINNMILAKELMGDGVIISTPFGSNAYYKTITGKNFSKGIGLAFNNIIKGIKSRVLNENSRVEIIINRENGYLGFDTSDKVIKLKKGDKILVKKSKEKAYIARRD